MPLNESTSKLMIHFSKKLDIFQPNNITESHQNFSEIEKKMVTCIVSQISTIKPTENEDDISLLIPLAELVVSNNHAKIKKAAESIQNKTIIFQTTQTKLAETIIPFQDIKISSVMGKDYLHVLVSNQVLRLYSDLRFDFTLYNYDVFFALSSMYSQRIYEIMMMRISRKKRKFVYSIEQLKFILNCPASYSYNEIRKRALTLAKSELEHKANIHFEFSPSKKDRKRILEIEFTITTPQEQLEAIIYKNMNSPNSTDLPSLSLLRLLNEYSLPKEQVNQIVTSQNLFQRFREIDFGIFSGEIKPQNTSLFLQKALNLTIKRGRKSKINS